MTIDAHIQLQDAISGWIRDGDVLFRDADRVKAELSRLITVMTREPSPREKRAQLDRFKSTADDLFGNGAWQEAPANPRQELAARIVKEVENLLRPVAALV
jgi:hypothetical protein